MRQTIETCGALQSIAERTTLVQAGSWRSAITQTRQPSGMKKAHGRNKATSNAPDSPATGSTADIPTRVLQWQHFESALLEISPSSTEDGTLPELKKVREVYDLRPNRTVGRTIRRWRVKEIASERIWQVIRVWQPITELAESVWTGQVRGVSLDINACRHCPPLYPDCRSCLKQI
jgi:hypothetical protein